MGNFSNLGGKIRADVQSIPQNEFPDGDDHRPDCVKVANAAHFAHGKEETIPVAAGGIIAGGLRRHHAAGPGIGDIIPGDPFRVPLRCFRIIQKAGTDTIGAGFPVDPFLPHYKRIT